MKETWKTIKDFEDYEVSDLGRVRSLKNGKVKILKPGISGGYLMVIFCKNGKQNNFRVHKLVVEAFIGPIPKGMQVNHINEDKLDNRVSNLEIVTPKQNTNHGTRNKRAGKAIASANSKELKLTNAKTCAKYTFPSSYEASEFFNYKSKDTVGVYIFKARKKGKNFIKIRAEKYYFVQESDKYIV